MSFVSITATYPNSDVVEIVSAVCNDSDPYDMFTEDVMTAVYSHYIESHAEAVLSFIEKDDDEDAEKLEWTYEELATECLQLFGSEESEFLQFQEDVEEYILLCLGGDLSAEPVYKFTWAFGKTLYELPAPKKVVSRKI